MGLFETDLTNQKESDHDHSGHDHSDHDHSGHDHSGHDHSKEEDQNKIEDFISVSFKTKEPFSLRKFQYFLDNQL